LNCSKGGVRVRRGFFFKGRIGWPVGKGVGVPEAAVIAAIEYRNLLRHNAT
jgi:hypothetical protein